MSVQGCMADGARGRAAALCGLSDHFRCGLKGFSRFHAAGQRQPSCLNSNSKLRKARSLYLLAACSLSLPILVSQLALQRNLYAVCAIVGFIAASGVQSLVHESSQLCSRSVCNRARRNHRGPSASSEKDAKEPQHPPRLIWTAMLWQLRRKHVA